MEHIYLDAFRISNYKSFLDAQEFSDLSKINIIIGKNNSGKSNALSWLSDKYLNISTSCRNITSSRIPNIEYYELDYPQGHRNEEFKIYFGLKIDGRIYNNWLLERAEEFKSYGNIDLLKRILDNKAIQTDNGQIWFEYGVSNNQIDISEEFVNKVYENSTIPEQEWVKIGNNFREGIARGHTWVSRTLRVISSVHIKIPQITFIPAIREIKDKITGNSENNEISQRNDCDGSGIIKQLARLQNPDHNSYNYSKKRFEKINNFLRNVTGNDSASIEIPATQDYILTKIDNKILPLKALGTGIHEVVILAAASTLHENQIICMEEPEIHLHPTLQRKLIKYLYENTSNQYFIATHSVHLLDSKLASIYHIQLENGYSKVEHVQSSEQQSQICIDLGYKASDIIQSNCIIWVEGPSDRIYLNYWIKNIAPEIEEGIHYSIMFYGGRLLSHLTVNDPEVEEFISLKRLNRNVAIVIDSDRKKPGDKINATKSRIRKEIEDCPGYVWITSGKEIENYVSDEVIQKAIYRVHPGATKIIKSTKYTNKLRYKNSDNKTKTADKIKIAHAVTNEPLDLSIDDLKRNIYGLIDFIKKSNDN